MSYFEFPHTRTYDSDLGWLIKQFGLMSDQVEALDTWAAAHKAEYADLNNKVEGLINNLVDVISPWDSSIAYHIFSIVEYQGQNYIAVQDVPVGAMITNTDYWQPANTVIEQINAIGLIVESVRKLEDAIVTPEMFGAVGDGVADETSAVLAAINSGKCVIGINNYGISQPIHPAIKSDQRLILNLKALNTMEYVLWIDAQSSSWTDLLEGELFITVDCDEKATDGIYYDRCHGAHMNFTVYNCLGTGVTGRKTSSLSCGGNHINVTVSNVNTVTVPTNSIAFKSGQDDHYGAVGGTDVNTGIVLQYGGNDFKTVHFWCSTLERVNAGSCCIDVKTSGYNIFDCIIADTMKSVFRFNTEFIYPSFKVNTVWPYNNTNVSTQKIYLVEVNMATSGTTEWVTQGIPDINFEGKWYSQVEWYDGTMPKVLYTNGETTSDTIKLSRIFSMFKVINMAFTREYAVNISSIINAENCFVPISELSTGNYVIDAQRYVASDYFVQKIASERGSASRRISKAGGVFPWYDNSINNRRVTLPVTITAGTTSATINTESYQYLTPGSLVTAIVQFVGIPQPDSMTINTSGKNLIIGFTAAWATANAGNRTVSVDMIYNMPTVA